MPKLVPWRLRMQTRRVLSRLRKPRTQPKEHIAARPHWITIVLSSSTVLSLLVAIVAIAINHRAANESLLLSRSALELSERNMKTGQRAYLAIRGGKLHAVQKDTFDKLPSAVAWLMETEQEQWAFEFEVVNLGNTPASLVQFDITSVLPRGWSLLSQPNDPTVSIEHFKARRYRQLGNLGPKSTYVGKYLVSLERPVRDSGDESFFPDAYSTDADAYNNGSGLIALDLLFSRGRVRSNIGFRYRLTYRDVFGDLHHEDWCWMADFRYDVPHECPPSIQ
jgi:hypothetical protein